jgi:hypothetical protein
MKVREGLGLDVEMSGARTISVGGDLFRGRIVWSYRMGHIGMGELGHSDRSGIEENVQGRGQKFGSSGRHRCKDRTETEWSRKSHWVTRRMVRRARKLFQLFTKGSNASMFLVWGFPGLAQSAWEAAGDSAK